MSFEDLWLILAPGCLMLSPEGGKACVSKLRGAELVPATLGTSVLPQMAMSPSPLRQSIITQLPRGNALADVQHGAEMMQADPFLLVLRKHEYRLYRVLDLSSVEVDLGQLVVALVADVGSLRRVSLDEPDPESSAAALVEVVVRGA